MTSKGFDAALLERSYEFLEDCPRHVLSDVITLPIGELRDRVRGARAWYDALLSGTLPPLNTWPPKEIAEPARLALGEMGLVRFCKDQPELVDALLKDIIASFAQRGEVVQSEVGRRLRELEELERIRLANLEKDKSRLTKLDDETLEKLRDKAEQEISSTPQSKDAVLIDTWGERARAWSEIAGVFGDLGNMLGRGWDMALGVLKQTGWADLLRLREVVKTLPQIREIVQSLGRLHVSDEEESVVDTVFVPIRRIAEERAEVKTPLVPMETRGVERSGNVARMLPSEAVMLGHPKMKLLWHARRSENALITYRVEGTEIEETLVEIDDMEEVEKRAPRRDRGPILAVIDTSGSMHGLPERVAKALVLEAVRTAHSERRECYLYAFSGPGQIMEHELDLSPEGIGSILKFLNFSFGGGTDIEVIEKVLQKLEDKKWKKSDVLVVSDGEWPASQALITSVSKTHDSGTRFHGVQIGNRGRTGLHEICGPVHVFRDWIDVGQ